MKYKLYIDKQGAKGYYKIDGFEGYTIDDNGKKKPKRYRESLKMYRFLKPKNPVERLHNKQVQAIADREQATLLKITITSNNPSSLVIIIITIIITIASPHCNHHHQHHHHHHCHSPATFAQRLVFCS